MLSSQAPDKVTINGTTQEALGYHQPKPGPRRFRKPTRPVM